MRKVNFEAGVNMLKALTVEQINELTASLVIYDESSALSENGQLNLDYGFIKEPIGEKPKMATNGSIVTLDMALADGEDIEYPEGLPGIMLFNYRVKELEGTDNSNFAECSVPVLSLEKDGKSYFLGDVGTRHGLCQDCQFGKMPEKDAEGKMIRKERNCLPMTKFVMLTVYPEADGTYGLCLMQFKGKGMRATPLKTSLTKLTNETKGKKYNQILKLHTKESDPFDVEDGKGKKVKKTIFLYDFTRIAENPEDPAMKAAQKELRDALSFYYASQHIYRTKMAHATPLTNPNLLADNSQQTAGVIDHKPAASAADDGILL